MSGGKLPTIEDVQKIDLDVVSLSFRSDQELRFRVPDPIVYPEYRPFDLVFADPRSFAGPNDLWDVRFCVRGPSPDGGGIVYEFETREVVPTEGRPYQVEVSGSGDPRVLFGRTAHEVKARIIAAKATVEDATT